MSIKELLQQRYATKQYQANAPLAPEKLDAILEAIRLTATSSGLQPFEIIVLQNTEIRAKMAAAGFNQSQIADSAAVLVFAAWDTYTAERINHMFDLTNRIRGGTSEGFENYRQMLLNTYPQRPAAVNFEHAARQAYIALGTALLAAAEQQVDATPMEGFNPAQLDELLDLPARGLKSVVLLALGQRNAEKDWLAPLPKVRKPMEELVRFVR